MKSQMDLGGEQLGLGGQGAGPMPAPPPTDAAETEAPRGKTHPGWRASRCLRRKQSGFLCRRLGLQTTAGYSTRGTRMAGTHGLAAGLASVCRALGGWSHGSTEAPTILAGGQLWSGGHGWGDGGQCQAGEGPGLQLGS